MTSHTPFRVKRSLLGRFLALLSAAFAPLIRRIMHKNPHAVAMWTFLGPLVSSSLYTLAKTGILNDLHENGPQTAAQLAEKFGLDENALYRIMRALAGINYLNQRKDGAFEATPITGLILKEHPESFHGMAMMYGDSMLAELPSFPETIKTGTSMVEINHDGKTVWQLLEQEPELADAFDHQMATWTELHAATVAKSYDFSSARSVVDIGGGRGTMMREILRANPNANGVIFDRPEVVIQTELRMQEAGLSDRCECVGGNFFESVPQGADFYVIKHVLHDWDDEHAVEILRNIRRAMRPDSRLLIVEGLVEHDFVGGEFFRRWWDIIQLAQTLGRARTVGQMQGMLEKSALQLDSLQPTALTDVLIMEVNPLAIDFEDNEVEMTTEVLEPAETV